MIVQLLVPWAPGFHIEYKEGFCEQRFFFFWFKDFYNEDVKRDENKMNKQIFRPREKFEREKIRMERINWVSL